MSFMRRVKGKKQELHGPDLFTVRLKRTPVQRGRSLPRLGRDEMSLNATSLSEHAVPRGLVGAERDEFAWTTSGRESLPEALRPTA